MYILIAITIGVIITGLVTIRKSKWDAFTALITAAVWSGWVWMVDVNLYKELKWKAEVSGPKAGFIEYTLVRYLMIAIIVYTVIKGLVKAIEKPKIVYVEKSEKESGK